MKFSVVFWQCCSVLFIWSLESPWDGTIVHLFLHIGKSQFSLALAPILVSRGKLLVVFSQEELKTDVRHAVWKLSLVHIKPCCYTVLEKIHKTPMGVRHPGGGCGFRICHRRYFAKSRGFEAVENCLQFRNDTKCITRLHSIHNNNYIYLPKFIYQT